MVDRSEDTAYFLSIDVSLQIRRTAIAGFGRHTARKETWYGHGCCRFGSELKYGQTPMFSKLKLFVYDHSDMIDHGKRTSREMDFSRTMFGMRHLCSNWHKKGTTNER